MKYFFVFIALLFFQFQVSGQKNGNTIDVGIYLDTQNDPTFIKIEELRNADHILVGPYSESLTIVKCIVSIQTGPDHTDLTELILINGQFSEEAKLYLHNLPAAQHVLLEHISVQTKNGQIKYVKALQLKVVN